MTNQAEPFAPAPPQFYWTLHLKSAAERAKARDRGETRAVDEFILKVDKAADLVARKNPDPKRRAEGYRNKPATDWAEQFLYMVKDCAEDWADWEKIAPEDEHLRDEIVQQIEALLGEAGIDLKDDDVQSSSAKMERYLAGTATPALNSGPAPAAAPTAPQASTYGPAPPMAL